ncbi:MAG: hypothetical protein LUH07_13695 [Lachnospiraceae bacterium]|nr:hypothetical protein [Lachnospiraceae bacterium]
MSSGGDFLSAWEKYQYIVATALSIIAIVVAVVTAIVAWKIYQFQKRDRQKEVLSSVASEFYAMFIKNFDDLYEKLMPIALKKEQATVEKCLMLLTEYPLKADFPYWNQNTGSILSILAEKHPNEEFLGRWSAMETFVRTAQKFTIRISSLKKDLVDAKGNGKTYFVDVNESSMNRPYIGFAQDVLTEMKETIEKLPDDLPIRSLKKE